VSLERIKATGRGKLHARVVIEGWGEQFVTAEAMEVDDVGDGRTRVVGLQIAGLQIGARVDLPSGKIDSEGFRVTIKGAKRGFAGLASLRRKPSARTFLSSYVDETATTIPVFSTEGFASSGTIHINTEAIRYTGTTFDSFTGCTRGAWDTVAQRHYVQGTSDAYEADAAGIAYPPVTDRPASLEGRRVWLYLYGEGDGLGGDGVLRWFGVASTCARFEGASASFSVDPPTSILKQQIGGDAARKVPIRGIYYPWSAPFLLPLTLCSGAVSGSPSTTAIVKLPGFFETQEAFCASLTTAIASATAAWGWPAGSAIYAEAVAGGFELVYTTPAAGSPRYVDVGGLGVDDAGFAGRRALELSRHDTMLDDRWVEDAAGPVATVVANRRYRRRWSSPVPRAYFGDATEWTRSDPEGRYLTSPADADTYPGSRIYFGGLVALSADTLVGGEEPAEPALGAFQPFGDLTAVASYDSATRSARLAAGMLIGDGRAKVFGPATRFRLGRKLAEGNVGDLIAYLQSSSALYCNAGAMPLVRSGDLSFSADDVDDALVGALVSDRVFVAVGQDVTLEELIGAELVAAGLHWTIDTSGTLGVRRVRLAASTDPATLHVTASRTVGGVPTIEEAATWGFVSAVHVLTGYDPIEEEHAGPEHHVVNVQASAPNRDGKTLTIEQRSIARARFYSPGIGMRAEPTIDDAVRIARVWLGLLGGTYDVLTLSVPMLAFDATIGDAIKVTSDFIMDDDGTMGIADKLGILIGYQWDLETGKGSLELLMHRRDIAGYAPGFRIQTITPVGVSEFDVLLETSEVTDESLDDWMTVGEAWRVVEQNTTTPTTELATIVSITGSTVRIAAAAWAPGTSEWALEPNDPASYAETDDLAAFVYVADATGRIATDGGTRAARVFSP